MTPLTGIVLALALAAPPAFAQQPGTDDPARERARQESEQRLRDAERDMEQAERRMQEARQQLREAERRLRQAARESAASEGGERQRRMSTVLLTNRARLGVVVDTSDAGRDADGAVVKAVTPGGPAERAGLQAGDVIVSINGQRLTGEGRSGAGRRLVELTAELEDGQRATVEYRRGGQSRTATLTARAMETGPIKVFVNPDALSALDEPLFGDAGDARWLAFPNRWLDLELVALDEDLGEYFGAREGLLVVRTPSDAALQLKAGDVLLRIGERTPTTPAQAVRILRSYEAGERVRLDVVRKGQPLALEIEMPRRSGQRLEMPRMHERPRVLQLDSRPGRV